MKPFTLSLVTLLAIACLFPASLHAGKKDDAKKQIAALNQKTQQAGDAGDLQAAIEAAEDALDTASKNFGEKSMEAAQAMNNVANLYMYAEHPADAEQLYKQAVLIEIKGKNDLALADSFYNLGMAYAMQEKYADARDVLNKAYKIRVEKLGPQDPESQKIQEALKNIWTDMPAA